MVASLEPSIFVYSTELCHCPVLVFEGTWSLTVTSDKSDVYQINYNQQYSTAHSQLSF